VEFFAGLFFVGLLLWWIIQSDLDKRDREKRFREENEKREARERAAKLEWEAFERKADIELRESNFRYRQEIIKYRREIQQELGRVDAAIAAIEAKQRQEQRRISRQEQFLNSCRDQCLRAQNDDGLLPLEAAGRILGWEPFETWEGTLAFNNRGGVRSENGLYFLGENGGTHPFPEEIQNGFFRTSDVITWIDEAERKEQPFRMFVIESLEKERQDKLCELERLHSERRKLVASRQQVW
jgi:hypothetical protein